MADRHDSVLPGRKPGPKIFAGKLREREGARNALEGSVQYSFHFAIGNNFFPIKTSLTHHVFLLCLFSADQAIHAQIELATTQALHQFKPLKLSEATV